MLAVSLTALVACDGGEEAPSKDRPEPAGPSTETGTEVCSTPGTYRAAPDGLDTPDQGFQEPLIVSVASDAPLGAADLDGDGRSEVLIADWLEPSPPDRQPSRWVNLATKAEVRVQARATGWFGLDLDGDGREEVLTGRDIYAPYWELACDGPDETDVIVQGYDAGAQTVLEVLYTHPTWICRDSVSFHAHAHDDGLAIREEQSEVWVLQGPLARVQDVAEADLHVTGRYDLRDTAPIDLDGDGRSELAVAGDDKLAVLAVDGSSHVWDDVEGIAPGARDLSPGDADGDGHPDLLVTRDEGAELLLGPDLVLGAGIEVEDLEGGALLQDASAVHTSGEALLWLGPLSGTHDRATAHLRIVGGHLPSGFVALAGEVAIQIDDEIYVFDPCGP